MSAIGRGRPCCDSVVSVTQAAEPALGSASAQHVEGRGRGRGRGGKRARCGRRRGGADYQRRVQEVEAQAAHRAATARLAGLGNVINGHQDNAADNVNAEVVPESQATQAQTLSDKRRLATQTRWSKQKAATSKAMKQNKVWWEASYGAIVAVHQQQHAPLAMDSPVALVVQAKPEVTKEDAADERGLWLSLPAKVTKEWLADKYKMSRKKVTKLARANAFAVVLCRRLRAQSQILQIHAAFQQVHGAGGVRALHFIVKYKYDEMAAKLTHGRQQDRESGTGKILQIVVQWWGLWQVSGRFVVVRWNIPSTLRLVDATSVRCMRPAIELQTSIPEAAANVFQSLTRMAVADEHVSNGLADSAILRDALSKEVDDEGYQRSLGRMSLMRFICLVHKSHRVASSVFDTYINERRGLLHACLSFSAAGTWKAYQKAWKQLITDTLVVFPWGLTGPGAEEIEKHEAVFSKYHYIADELVKPGAFRKRQLLLRRRRLFNGRWGSSRIQHFCKGAPHCCNGPQDTLAQFHEYVDQEQPPPLWSQHRWKGVLPALEWMGFYMEVHNQAQQVFEIAFASKKEQKAMQTKT